MSWELLLSASAAIADEASDNLAWLSLTGALTVGALFITWTYLRRLFRWVMVKLDDVIPADLSALHKPFAYTCSAIVSAMLITGAAISVAQVLGADTTDVREWLKDFGAGVGEWVRERFLKIVLIIAATGLLMRAARRVVPRAVERFVSGRARPDTLRDEVQKRQTTLESALVGVIRIFLVLVAVIMVMSELGLAIAPLLTAAGVVGIAIGFGAQSLIKDVLAGVFILLEDQYRVGDVIVVDGHGGMVEEINLRRTVLRDLEAAVHIIPNGEVGKVKNLTKDKSRVMIDLPVAYKEDLDRCFQVINRVGEEMQRDPKWAPFITEPIRALRVDDFADSAVIIRVLGQTLPLKQWDVAGEFRLRIKRAFDEEGIEIPFPHRTVYWGAAQPPFHRAADGDALAGQGQAGSRAERR